MRVLALTLLIFTAEASARISVPYAKNTCTADEKWYFGKTIDQKTRDAFRSWVPSRRNRQTPADAFAYSEATKKTPPGVARTFARYWKFRVLHHRRVHHVAERGFTRVFIGNHPYYGIKLAALECLNRVYTRYPTIDPHLKLGHHLATFARDLKNNRLDRRARRAVSRMAAHLAMHYLRRDPRHPELKVLVPMVGRKGPHVDLVQGLLAAGLEQYPKAIRQLTSFVKRKRLAQHLARFLDPVHLSLARMAVHTGEYSTAEKHYKKVSSSSNYRVRVINELAWLHFIRGKRKSAIGVAQNLKKAGLRDTYSPEGIMVLSMAFHELCLYPASLRAVNFFKKNFSQAYEYLEKNKNRRNFYHALVSNLERKNPSIPKVVLSEWAQSPVFISAQEELNLLIDEGVRIDRFSTHQLSYFRQKYEDQKSNRAKIKRLQEKYVEIANNKGDATKVARSLKEAIALDRYLERHIAEVNESMVDLENEEARFDRRSEQVTPARIARVNRNIRVRSQVMRKRLKSFSANTELVRIEILGGASQDILWRKANPQYQEFVEKFKQRHRKGSGAVWRWGSDNSELWDDEITQLMANVHNDCLAKDKFTQVQMYQF